MSEKCLSIRNIQEFSEFLRKEERSQATVEKYVRDIRTFDTFLGEDKQISKERVIAYKKYLSETYKVSSANSMLAALNQFLNWFGLHNCRVKSFKNQKQMFCDQERELNQEEYQRLIEAARKGGNPRLEMIMQTICGTGIRIGELPYITVEAVCQGKAEVYGKGKRRLIFIVPKLKKYLLSYCKKQKIRKGPVFIAKSGKPINRSNVWAEMKALAEQAGVDAKKIFPHNLRHLFARICYKKKKDIVYLADVLGHSSVETTRIYTISSGREHQMMLASLGLVL